MKSFLVLFITLVSASSLSAHPTGHEGGVLETARHFVTHPDHLLTWGAVLLLGAGMVYWKVLRLRKNRTDR